MQEKALVVWHRGVLTCAADRWVRENGFVLEKKRMLCPSGARIRYRNLSRLAARLFSAGLIARSSDFVWSVTVFESHEDAERQLVAAVRGAA